MTVFEYLFMAIVAGVLAAIVLFGYMRLKLENATKNQLLITAAIFLYKKDCIEQADFIHIDDVQYEDMEELKKTLYRMTDWGYKRILPKEKYRLIKPYIHLAKIYRTRSRN